MTMYGLPAADAVLTQGDIIDGFPIIDWEEVKEPSPRWELPSTVGPLRSWENDSDLGNLFRFLALLGIVGIHDEALVDTQPEEPESEAAVDWSQFSGREHLDAVRALLAGREPVPTVDGPVDLAFTDLVHLLTVSHFCDADDGPVMISLRLPVQDFTRVCSARRRRFARHTAGRN